jgi:hypothetical protein
VIPMRTSNHDRLWITLTLVVLKLYATRVPITRRFFYAPPDAPVRAFEAEPRRHCVYLQRALGAARSPAHLQPPPWVAGTYPDGRGLASVRSPHCIREGMGMTARLSEGCFEVRHRVINKLRGAREHGVPLAATQSEVQALLEEVDRLQVVAQAADNFVPCMPNGLEEPQAVLRAALQTWKA